MREENPQKTSGLTAPSGNEQEQRAPITERVEWLSTLCDPWRPPIAQPFCAEVDGVRMIGATEGHGITLLRAQADETAPAFKRISEALGMLTGIRWHTVPMADIDAWLMRHRRRCGACGGLGFQAAPDLAAFDSGGGGPVHNLWLRCGCQRPGVAEGVRIDKRVALDHIGPLKAKTIEIGGNVPKQMLAFRTPDWLVLVMGLTRDGEDGVDTDPDDVFASPVEDDIDSLKLIALDAASYAEGAGEPEFSQFLAIEGRIRKLLAVRAALSSNPDHSESPEAKKGPDHP